MGDCSGESSPPPLTSFRQTLSANTHSSVPQRSSPKACHQRVRSGAPPPHPLPEFERNLQTHIVRSPGSPDHCHSDSSHPHSQTRPILKKHSSAYAHPPKTVSTKNNHRHLLLRYLLHNHHKNLSCESSAIAARPISAASILEDHAPAAISASQHQ